MKYKVFLDTNDVFSDKAPLDEPFNLRAQELRKFLDGHEVTNVEICLPEIVIRERVQQRLDDIDTAVSLANDRIRALNKVGHKTKEIKPHKNYKKNLELKVEEYLEKNRIVRMPMPSISKENLLDRAILKLKPFNDNGAGFKDTLIFFSIVEDALGESAADAYIFCTNDSKEFTDEVIEEFKKKTGKDLHIIPSIAVAPAKLDELLPLNLHLEERNNKIKNLIGENTGKLMEFVNRHAMPFIPSARTGRAWLTAEPEMDDVFLRGNYAVTQASGIMGIGSRSDSSKPEVMGYNYGNVQYLNFSESENGKYHVSLWLEGRPVYQDKNDFDPTVAYVTTFSINDYYHRPTSKTFSVEVSCDLEKRTVEVIGVGSMPY